jgi:hypothetical protein
MPGTKRPSSREECDDGRDDGILRRGGYAGASGEVATMVGPSARDGSEVCSPNGFPQLAQNGVACALSVPHD